MASDRQAHRRVPKPASQPPNLHEIQAALQEARTMSSWGDNWDGQGSPGYSKATLERAAAFLVQSTRELWQRHQRVVPVPQIEPGPDGSVDFHWQAGDRELLLNLPSDPNEMVDFYGDSSAGESIKGRAYTSTVGPWLLSWLTR